MKQRPRKRIWGAAFMLALVVSILPAVLLNADAGSGAHDHTSSDWVYLTASDTVIVDDSVYYCLNDAVTLDYGLSIGDGGNECTFTLCLNGQTLSCADYGPTVTVRDGATLILCDCQGGGAVEAPDGDVISVEEGGKLILQSGTITAGELPPELYDPEFPPEVTGVSLSGGEFEMVGGEIADCYIGVHVYDGEFDMTGGTIKDCETGVSAEGEYESDYWEVFDGVFMTGGVPSISESHLVTARQLTFPVFTMTDGTIETCQTGVFAKHAVFNMSGDAFIHACNGYGVSLDCAYEAYYAGSFDFYGDPISSYIPYDFETLFNMTGGRIENCGAGYISQRDDEYGVSYTHSAGSAVDVHHGSAFEMSGNSQIVFTGEIHDFMNFPDGVPIPLDTLHLDRSFTLSGINGVLLSIDSTFTMNGGKITGCRGVGVEVGETSRFDMYDGEISGNTYPDYDRRDASNDSHAVSVGNGESLCEFNMHGGKICGNTAGQGSGLYINTGGVVNLYDGEICHNEAPATHPSDTVYSYGGGGAYVAGGTLNMYGGSIHHNEAFSNGGGVGVGDGVLNIYNGEICDNKAVLGGGVYLNASMGMEGFHSSDDAPVVWVPADVSYGELNMYGGSIHSNRAVDGNGVVTGLDSSNMAGGNYIVGDPSAPRPDPVYGDASGGGGVYVSACEEVVSRDDPKYAHLPDQYFGVYLGSAVFHMYGGEIYENHTEDPDGDGTGADGIENTAGGGGVHVVPDGTFLLSGGYIEGNIVDVQSGQAEQNYSNVYLEKGAMVVVTNELDEETKVGVLTEEKPRTREEISAGAPPLYFAEGDGARVLTDAYVGKLVSDNPDYMAAARNGKLYLEDREHAERHCICGGDENCTEHEQKDWILETNGWDKWFERTGGVVSGTENVFLNHHVKLDASTQITVEDNATLYLCLNGFILENTNDYIVVESGGTLVICDCFEEQIGGSIATEHPIEIVSGATVDLYSGKITRHLQTGAGGGVEVSGTFNMHGGTITRSDSAGIDVYSGGTLAMSGGSVTRNADGGVVVQTGGTFELWGATTIKDNTNAAGNDYNVVLYDHSTIGIAGELTNKDKIGVTMLDGSGNEIQAGGVFTVNWSDNMPADKEVAVRYFTADGDFIVELDATGTELRLSPAFIVEFWVDDVLCTEIRIKVKDDSLHSIGAFPEIPDYRIPAGYRITGWETESHILWDVDNLITDHLKLYAVLDEIPNWVAPDSEKDPVDPFGDDDGDGIPNAVDPDDDTPYDDPDADGDNVEDWRDPDHDTDGDGKSDKDDNNDDNDALPDAVDPDDDGDGILDKDDPDNKDFWDPQDDRPHDKDGDGLPDDTDGDGIPDVIDPDADNDGIPDSKDNPINHNGDDDNDGDPNKTDPDDDGDGIPDWFDPTTDSDGDGIPDVFDPDDDNDRIPDTRDDDDDGDGIPDSKDPDHPSNWDKDGDGIADDNDGDGIPDWIDPDDDNDGIPDKDDPYPNDPNRPGKDEDKENDQYTGGDTGGGIDAPPLADTDGDGIPDVIDPDDDNDGIPDFEDDDPLGKDVADPSDPDCPCGKFDDIDHGAWYEDYVDYVVENGLMNGISSSLFDPNGTTTRAQTVMILWRMEGEPLVSHPLYFSDVSEGVWYIDALRWANSENIVLGYDDGRFGPNDPVTREQIATILWRYARFRGIDTSAGGNVSLLKFSDAKKVSAYAISALQWACGEDIINGTVNAQGAIVLDPQGTATRAQIAAILMRFCENVL